MSIFSNKPKVTPVAAPVGTGAGSAAERGTAPLGTSPVEKSDEQWRQELTPEEYRVLREKGTERPFTGRYENTKEPGTYVCAACGNPLFSSDTKYESGSGWPSFYRPLSEESVATESDRSHFCLLYTS